jgi:GT2 family glycosyltransferase
MVTHYSNFFRTAVVAVDLEQIAQQSAQDLTGFDGYLQAFVVVRFRGSVIGQLWVPIEDNRIRLSRLRSHSSAMAWRIWQQTMVAEPDMVLPSATVVVCTRDRTIDLARCLPPLAKLAAQGYEVIIVDSCPSNQKTERLVADYPMIRYIHESRPGAGIARNRGLQAATQPIVAFTDDDAVIDEGWLVALLRNFDDPMVAVVTGITMPLELETAAQYWFEQTNGFNRGFDRKIFDMISVTPLAAGVVGASVNVAIRRSALSEIGLFHEALGPGTPATSGEDHEFFYRTLACGYRIVYEPAALVWHRHRYEWDALRRTIYSYGRAVFAWWTHALLQEKEFTLLLLAPRWFWQHHTKNLLQALLRRPHHVPLDLAWAEFWGALTGPFAYFQSQRWLRRINQRLVQEQAVVTEKSSEPRISTVNEISLPLAFTALVTAEKE